MFTKNYYKILARAITYDAIKESVTLIRTNGSERVVAASYTNQFSGSFTFGRNANYPTPSLYYPRFITKATLETANQQIAGVVFGAGTTPPTIDDYTMSGELLSAGSAVTNVEIGHDDTGEYWKATYTINNTGDSEFTIGEVGLVAGAGSGNSVGPYLIERTVLDSPVTIPAGGVGQVTYTIRMNYPAA